MYSELLSTRRHRAKARKLLSIILAATRPLSTEELSIAMAVEPEFKTFDDSTHTRRRPARYTFLDVKDNLMYPFKNYIKGLCGNFICIIKGKVCFVHKTTRVSSVIGDLVKFPLPTRIAYRLAILVTVMLYGLITVTAILILFEGG